MRFGEILGYAVLILAVYAFKDEIIHSVKNKKILIAWILLSGIVLVGGVRITLLPGWQGQESYETLEYAEGRCEYKKRSRLDPYRYYIYGTDGTLLANVSAANLPEKIEKLHGEHVSVWYKKTFGKYGKMYEIAIEGKTIDTVEETNKNIMHVNLVDNMLVYTSIVFWLLFITNIIAGLFEEIVSRLCVMLERMGYFANNRKD